MSPILRPAKRKFGRTDPQAGRYALPGFPVDAPERLRELFARTGLAEALAFPGTPAKAGSAEAVLQALFLGGEALPAAAFPDAERFRAAGLLEVFGGLARSRFKVQSYEGLFLLSDLPARNAARDYVLQVGPAGHYLARLTVRRRVESALDLGCGCGVQALLAARHAARVTATDINPRALALTAFNAALSGIPNVELLEGSFFEPLRGRRFDLIVANLPYVIAPPERTVYRRAEGRGDTRLRRLVRQMPAFLDPGGYAHLLANWVQTGPDPSRALRAALRGAPADAWLIVNGSKQMEPYARMWLEPAPDDRRTLETWLDWYRRQGIGRVALGALTLRRRGRGRPRFETAEVLTALQSPAGDQFERLFAAGDALAGLGRTERLLDRVLLPEALELDEDCLRVPAAAGLGLQARVRPGTLRVLQALDSRSSLRTIVERTCPAESAAVLADFTELVRLGMVRLG